MRFFTYKNGNKSDKSEMQSKIDKLIDNKSRFINQKKILIKLNQCKLNQIKSNVELIGCHKMTLK